jgi:hypothetical protein
MPEVFDVLGVQPAALSRRPGVDFLVAHRPQFAAPAAGRQHPRLVGLTGPASRRGAVART